MVQGFFWGFVWGPREFFWFWFLLPFDHPRYSKSRVPTLGNDACMRAVSLSTSPSFNTVHGMVSTSFILTLCSQIIFSKFTFSTQKTNSQSRFKTSLSSDQQRWKIPASSVRRKEKEGEKNGTAGTDWYLFSIKRACV